MLLLAGAGSERRGTFLGRMGALIMQGCGSQALHAFRPAGQHIFGTMPSAVPEADWQLSYAFCYILCLHVSGYSLLMPVQAPLLHGIFSSFCTFGGLFCRLGILLASYFDAWESLVAFGKAYNTMWR